MVFVFIRVEAGAAAVARATVPVRLVMVAEAAFEASSGGLSPFAAAVVVVLAVLAAAGRRPAGAERGAVATAAAVVAVVDLDAVVPPDDNRLDDGFSEAVVPPAAIVTLAALDLPAAAVGRLAAVPLAGRVGLAAAAAGPTTPLFVLATAASFFSASVTPVAVAADLPVVVLANRLPAAGLAATPFDGVDPLTFLALVGLPAVEEAGVTLTSVVGVWTASSCTAPSSETAADVSEIT